jgi:hypothetical protein
MHETCAGHDVGVPRSVETFLGAHADKARRRVKTGARQKLTEAITALDLHASDQTGGALASQGATQKKLSLRQALLRDHMAKIARIAAADLPNVPELEPLRMPRGKPTVEKLAAAASDMAKTAAPYADVFISAGLSQDFIRRPSLFRRQHQPRDRPAWSDRDAEISGLTATPTAARSPDPRTMPAAPAADIRQSPLPRRE